METTKNSLLLDWNDVVYEGRNDLVFEHKNRDYGAYQIRREYHGNMIVAMGSTLMIFLGLLAIPIISGLFKEVEEVVITPDNPDERTLTEYIIPLAEPTPKDPAPKRTSLAALAPKIVPDEQLPKETKEPEKKVEEPRTSTSGEKGNENGKEMGSSKGSGTEPTLADPSNNSEYVTDFPSTMPEYEGGLKAMYEDIGHEIIYPAVPRELGKSGTVFVSFVVNRQGDVSDVQLLKGVANYPEFDAEALRVIRKLKRWKPGIMNGHSVSVRMRIPIRFVTR